MKCTRILLIAPYEEFQALALQIAREFPGVKVESFIGNLDSALDYLQNIPLSEYDAVVSRGGTASELRQVLQIPIIEAEVSVYDMLRSLKIADASRKRFAVVGYQNIIETARTLCQILNYTQVKICEVTQETVDSCVQQLVESGIQLIIGDVVTIETTGQLGFPSILVTSSADSIRKAFRMALLFSKTCRQQKEEYAIFRSAADLCGEAMVVFDSQQHLVFANSAAKSLDLAVFRTLLQGEIPGIKPDREYRFIRRGAGCIYDITAATLQVAEHNYYLFCIYKSNRILSHNSAIRIENYDDPLGPSHFLFSDSTYIKPVLAAVNRAFQGKVPVMICGAIGTEKASVARYIHRNSAYRTRPLLCIDCQTITEAQWNHLTESHKSPLADTGCTLLFENIHLMPLAAQAAVGSYLEDTQLSKRHLLLSTCVGNPNQLLQEARLIRTLYRNLYQLVIQMPSLDSRGEDLEALASIYIAQFNELLGRQVVGLEPEALEALQAFHWSLNLDQFQKAIHQLVENAANCYITGAEMDTVLSRVQTGQPEARGQLDLSKSLDEIEKDIIRLVLAEEGMNQSRAAKRLNIGRCTLWRRLS